MICNPYAMFKYLIEKEEFQKFTHIWVIDDFEKNQDMIDVYKEYPNVRFVKFRTREYCKALAVSQYLINNVSFPGYFLKRKEQIYLNTWHGTPMKNMGFDIPGANVTQGNTARNLLSADYILSSGSYMTEIAYKKSYKMKEIFQGTVLEEGFPRTDVFFNEIRTEILRKLQNQGVSVDEKKKVILYAPTWKGDKYSDPDMSLQDFYDVIKLAEKNIDTEKYQILVKPHQIVYHYMQQSKVDLGKKKRNSFQLSWIQMKYFL